MQLKNAQPGMQATRYAFPIGVRGLNIFQSPSVSGVPPRAPDAHRWAAYFTRQLFRAFQTLMYKRLLLSTISFFLIACQSAPTPVQLLHPVIIPSATSISTSTNSFVTPTPPQSAETRSDQILFISNRTGKNEIYSMNIDGSKATRLIPNMQASKAPMWSPNGEKFAFIGDKSDNQTDGEKIYVADADGSNIILLRDDFLSYDDLQWSKDGSHIAFTAVKDKTSLPQIYIMRADGADLIQVTRSSHGIYHIDWSPDNQEFIAISYISGITEFDQPALARINISNSSITYITPQYETMYGNPLWSADGNRIVFVADIDYFGGYYLFEIKRDGTALKRISGDIEAFSGTVTWSPDGQYIAFANNRHGNNTGDANPIYLMKADGSDLRELTLKTGIYSDISWSPDSQSIVFTGFLYLEPEINGFEILKMPINGSEMINISDNAADDFSPSWQPNQTSLP